MAHAMQELVRYYNEKVRRGREVLKTLNRIAVENRLLSQDAGAPEEVRISDAPFARESGDSCFGPHKKRNYQSIESP